LNGGVALFHTVVEGKHCYEVEKVLTNKPSAFGSKGDKLMMINDIQTEHLPPKQLIRMLSSGCPLLTLHQACVDDTEIKCPEYERMKPYHKEDAELSFSLDMVREKCLDEDEKNPRMPEEWECNDRAFDSCNDEKMLIVSMMNTSIAIVQARGCDALSPCRCGNTNCTFSDVIMATQQSAITSGLVIRFHIHDIIAVIFESVFKSLEFECTKKEFEQQLYSYILQFFSYIKIQSISNACLTANITIFYYMSNALDDFDKGVPVVLNFSGSTNFLKCMRLNDRPVLTVECCEKNKLQVICKDDPKTWPFVFYLKSTKDNHRRFESASCNGWFIHTKPSGLVCVDQGSNYTESNFYIIIHLENK
ncbi:interleukin-1 family member A, partial [Silurus meridionalis]